ncbi:MAG: signal peptidase I [Ruminococcus sp.]|nr:signal peptidase I [Ruminococcus sp.]
MKKVLKIVVNVLAWILLIFALIVTILVFSSSKNNGVSSLFGFIPMTVESPSMEPTFKQDDLIIVREVDDVASLKKDDVITYWTFINNQRVKNTHRIVEINYNDGAVMNFITRGDANSVDDDTSVAAKDVIGKWNNFRIPGFGKVMRFLQTRTGFFICIVIPMALFFLFELYKFIMTIIELKKPTLSDEDEEEIKRRAVEEYLAAQKAAAEAQAAAGTDDAKPETEPAGEETKTSESSGEETQE